METTHEMLRMGEKNSHNSKTIMRGWHKASTMNLHENEGRFKRNSSSVFTNPRMTTRNSTMNC